VSSVALPAAPPITPPITPPARSKQRKRQAPAAAKSDNSDKLNKRGKGNGHVFTPSRG
ncbi:hypothetical protein BGZ80_001912, partial [Entomortierella chlamydospora]